MREEDLAMAKAICAENLESPGPLRRNISSEERAKTFRWVQWLFNYSLQCEVNSNVTGLSQKQNMFCAKKFMFEELL